MTSFASLESVLVNHELDSRPARPPDYESENRALTELVTWLGSDDADVLQRVADMALDLCCAQSAGITIADEERGRKVFRWHAAAGRWAAFRGGTIPCEASPSGMVLDRRSPLPMAQPGCDFAFPSDAPPIAEALLVPLAVGDELIGTVWVLAHDDERRFDREDLRVLTSLSGFAAVAWELRQRKAAAAALSQERAGAARLQELSAGLIRERNIDALYRQVLEAAVAIMDSDFASMQTFHEESRELELLAWKGFHPTSAEHWHRIRLHSPTSCGSALRGRQRVVVSDTEEWDEIRGTRDLEEYRRSGIRSMQSTPLLSRAGVLLGMISTHWRGPHVPSSGELRMFDLLARQAADLVERTQKEHALRDADRRKDEFLAMLGHELRNPLAPLSTGLELLQRSGNQPELVQSVHSMMSRQLSHLVRLVDDLLDLARITRNKIELRRTPLDVRVVIESAVELSRPLIDQRRHELAVEHAQCPLPILGDFQRLTQVVANVLSNAAKYMERGGRIELRTSYDGDNAVVRIRDRGIGISPRHLEEVFEMFSQVGEHRVGDTQGGLGIGLALSRRLLELHGGSIVATSEGPGAGSEFIIRVPLGDAAVKAVAARGIADAGAIPRRVLVIDDNTDAAVSLRVALEMLGHTVQTMHDGFAGLAACEAFQPEVVLLDIGLPGMSGYDVARRIRSMQSAKDLLLVAITGWGQESDRVQARAAGFDAHLTKPVTLEALQDLMDAYVPGETNRAISDRG